MNIEELKDKHEKLFWTDDISNLLSIKQHTKLSIQFAIEILKNVIETASNKENPTPTIIVCIDKIQELKQYLDEKV